MAVEEAKEQEEGAAASAAPKPPKPKQRWFALRGTIPKWFSFGMSLLFVLLVLGLWFFLTSPGMPREDRIASPSVIGSPAETLDSLHALWFDRALTRNVLVTLRRVLLGFLLATSVGIPLGIMCGCFAPVHAFFLPLTVFGRNIPLAALIPLTFSMFGIGEFQKIMFIFIACVMFITWDTATSIRDVSQRYVDTAYTLGASRWQVIMKVLTPLALPSVFNSLRLLFGLAFGYIMLAELVKLGSEAGGLGDIIRQSQRRGMVEHIWLVLLLIPLLALAIDQGIYWIQRSLFPHRYGGSGTLNRLMRFIFGQWNDLKTRFFSRSEAKS
jgi:ABC-type nitrate/sulfonate/bicarbonate transport system permease component